MTNPAYFLYCPKCGWMGYSTSKTTSCKGCGAIIRHKYEGNRHKNKQTYTKTGSGD